LTRMFRRVTLRKQWILAGSAPPTRRHNQTLNFDARPARA
jgi:hypothetical protein